MNSTATKEESVTLQQRQATFTDDNYNARADVDDHGDVDQNWYELRVNENDRQP